SGVTGAPTCTTTRTPASPVTASGYPITCVLGTLAANNYDFHFVAGKLTVTKATLEVTADDVNREYGDANGSLGATISGFKNGENLASSGVTGAPTCTTTRTPASPVTASGYPITCVLGTLAANNYDFHFVAGKLTVTKATLEVTADDVNREYGAANGALGATISGFKNGENLASSGVTGAPTCTTTRTPASPVTASGYPITCVLGTLAANNYDFHFVAGKLTVTK